MYYVLNSTSNLETKTALKRMPFFKKEKNVGLCKCANCILGHFCESGKMSNYCWGFTEILKSSFTNNRELWYDFIQISKFTTE